MKEFELGTMYWINPLLTQGEMDEDFLKMRENGMQLVRCIVWWELIEEKEGQYEFSHIDRFFSAAEKTGLQVMATIGFYPPFWLTAKLDAANKNDPGRYPCLEHPEVKEPLAILIEKLVLRYRNSPALKYWNLWNEPTVNASKNRPMLENFAEYLKEVHPTLEELRKKWRGEYPVFSFLCPDSLESLNADWLEQAFRLGNRGRCSSMLFDWYRFLSVSLERQLDWLNQEVKRHDNRHQTHSNLSSVMSNPHHGGRNPFRLAYIPDSISFSIHSSNDYEAGVEVCDRFSYFSCTAELAYSWTHGAVPCMAGEVQAGTTYAHSRQYTPSPLTMRKEFWQSVATGLNGLIYWQWQAWRGGTFELGDFGLRNASDGAPTERSQEVAAFSTLYKKHQNIFSGLSRQKADIAILVSSDNFIYKMLFQADHPDLPRHANEANDAIFGCFRALEAANLACEFVSEEQLEDGLLKNYKVLYLPGVELMSEKTAGHIKHFITQGGSIYADGRTAYLDEYMYLRKEVPGHKLCSLFGAGEADFIAMPERVQLYSENKICASGMKMKQILNLRDKAKASAFFADGSVAAVDKNHGKGRSRLVGAQLCRALRDYNDDETMKYIASFALDCGVTAPVTTAFRVSSRYMSGTTHDVLIVFNNTRHKVELKHHLKANDINSLYHEFRWQDSELSYTLEAEETGLFIIAK